MSKFIFAGDPDACPQIILGGQAAAFCGASRRRWRGKPPPLAGQAVSPTDSRLGRGGVPLVLSVAEVSPPGPLRHRSIVCRHAIPPLMRTDKSVCPTDIRLGRGGVPLVLSVAEVSPPDPLRHRSTVSRHATPPRYIHAPQCLGRARACPLPATPSPVAPATGFLPAFDPARGVPSGFAQGTPPTLASRGILRG